jgi:hypothetical protein
MAFLIPEDVLQFCIWNAKLQGFLPGIGADAQAVFILSLAIVQTG